MGPNESTGSDEAAREVVDLPAREPFEETAPRYDEQLVTLVAAVVGGGLMMIFALGMAGVALLSPDASVVLGGLALFGAVLFAGGVVVLFRADGVSDDL